jgi:hypothetical protein
MALPSACHKTKAACEQSMALDAMAFMPSFIAGAKIEND